MAVNSRSLVLVIVGVVLVLVGVAADVVGIGGHPGFGWKQILLVAVGVVVTIVGGLGLRSKET
jgi:hypothetical protein